MTGRGPAEARNAPVPAGRAQHFNAEVFLARLWALDAQLAARGFHPMSLWWRDQIARFIRALAAGRARTAAVLMRRWVIRAGRRSGKSSTLCRVAVAWAKWGPWSVPAGDIAVVAFLSISRDEAGARMRTIGAILDVLGERYESRADEIAIAGARPVLFKVYAPTIRAVGFTGIMVVGDELARWESRETAANPAREVIGSLMPTMATQPFAFAVLCSSPWGADDYHAECFEAGDSDAQRVSFAPTWIANPSITEADTHALEPDPRVWSREYAAEPGDTLSAAFDAADIAAAFDLGRDLDRDPDPSGAGFVATDASSLRGDAFAWIAGWCTSDGRLAVCEVDAFDGDRLRGLSMDTVVATIAKRARAWGVATVYGDQREEAALRALFGQHRIDFRSYAWSEPSKDTAMQLLRRLMRERRLALCDHAQLRRELTGLRARLVPSGRIRYETNGLDYASALITLAHAMAAEHFAALDYVRALETMKQLGCI